MARGPRTRWASFAPARLARRLVELLGPTSGAARQSLIALAFNSTTSFVAGLVLVSITDTFRRLPGLLVLIPAAIGLKTTPSLDITRYNLHIVMAMILAASWAFSSTAWSRAREGLVTAAIVLSLIPFFWLEGWNWTWVSTRDIDARWRHPFSSPREYVDKPVFDLLGRQRSLEVRAGARVVFDQEIDFPGALFNFDFSNRVDYLPYTSSASYLAKLRELEPTWVAVGGQPQRRLLEQSGEWELVGLITPVDGDVVFRRKSRAAR